MLMRSTQTLELRTWVAALAPWGMVVWVSRAAPPAGWPGLMAHVAGAAALMLCVWWCFELRAGERAHYLARMRMVLPG